MNPLPACLGLAVLFAAFTCPATVAQPLDRDAERAALGERLFFDVNLSRNRSQSCATCHDPARGFSDPRGAGSPGDGADTLGDRNAPGIPYAGLVPPLARRADGEWLGGLFQDGRVSSLAEQAGGPILNPIEMGMPDKASAVARLAEDPVYAEAFPRLFGMGILQDPEMGYDALTQALAAYEARPEISPFDSKYDRFLRGEAELTREEELGRLLFFSEQFTNCNQCHQLSQSAMDPRETFTDHRYHNIGVPENTELRARNGVATGTQDMGLAATIDDPEQAGKFRTPTLRNVAVTGPYMHNGVFADLRTVILFYNRYNSRDPKRWTNPETGEPFGVPQVPQTLAVTELTHGPALDDQRIDALVAFLETLTDSRYEPQDD
ncbi:cytochrome c peroxidase [Donghicola mangrovi]|uniref:Methylamine utilization protein MauG n=1 Tax=Donghicola mangrovi TaxID=2729614 RepID=A0A850QEK7_9RHOB|nr:methylamine utilization protein MauG [Donghicola mangrovi]